MEHEKSKSAVKRELRAIHDLGRELVALPDAYITKLPLSEEITETIRAARSMSRGARQRQLRYLGGLLAHEDVETITKALRAVVAPTQEAVEHFHEIERLRDSLLSDGDTGLNDFLVAHPLADRQKLRQLVRNAIKEKKEDKPPKFARLLFRYLKELGL